MKSTAFKAAPFVFKIFQPQLANPMEVSTLEQQILFYLERRIDGKEGQTHQLPFASIDTI